MTSINKKTEEEIFTEEKSISSIPSIVDKTITKEIPIINNITEKIFTDTIVTNKEMNYTEENIENSKKMIIKTNIEKSIMNESDIEEIFTEEKSSQEFIENTTYNNLTINDTYYNDKKTENLFSDKAKEETIINDYTDNLLFSEETQKEFFTEEKTKEKSTDEKLEEFSDFNIKTEEKTIITIKESTEEIIKNINTTGFITEEKSTINPIEEITIVDALINIKNSTEVIFNEKDSDTINITNIVTIQENITEIDNITSTQIITTNEIIPQNVIIIPTNLTKENMVGDLSTILANKEIGINYKYIGPNYTLIIKPINSEEFNKDSTNIDFSQCEKKLREKYNIPDSEILTITQLEINNTNLQVLTNQVEYKIFDANKNPLDISICKDSGIVINQIMNSNSLNSIKLDLVKEFKNLDVDVFNISDPFFNDLCKPFNYQNNDIILEDRYNFIYQNYSFCEKGCNSTNIDFEKKIVTCECQVKQEMSTKNTEPNFQYIDNRDKLKNSNIDVIKCTDLIFDFKNKSKNEGFILFFILVIIFIFLIILHFYRGIKPVVDFVYNEMKKYNYLKKDDRKFFEETKNDQVTKFNNYKTKKTITNGNVSMPNNNNTGGPRSILSKKKRPLKNASNLMELNKLNKNKSKLSNASSERNLVFNSNFLFQNNQNILGEPKLNPPIKKISKIKKKGISNKRSIKNKKTNQKQKDTVLEVKNDKEEKKEEEVDNFGIIKIDLNESMENYFPKDSYRTLHNYTFKEATKYDNRNVCQVLYIFLLAKQILFHTFLEKSPLVPFQAKLSLLIFMFSFDLTLNALLYTNSNISKKYQTTKSLLSFTMTNNTMIIIVSTLVSLVFISILIKLSKTEGSIRAIFRKEEDKIKKNKKYKVDYPTKMRIFSEVEDVLKKYKIKLFILFFFEFIIILFCWYFVTAFCQVYSNTQGSLILNCFMSILIRLVIEVLICLAGAKLYTVAAQSEFLKFYNFMLFVYDLSC